MRTCARRPFDSPSDGSAQPDQPIAAPVLKLIDDKSWTVRRQLAASLGELPGPARVDPAVTILTRDGADPIIVDATLSSLKGVEADVLARVMQARPPAAPPSEAVAMLAAAVTKSGDVAGVQRIIDAAVDASRPAWQRTALLQGLDAALPAAGAAGRGGRGGGGGRRRSDCRASACPAAASSVTAGRGVALPAEPTALAALATARINSALLAAKRRRQARLARPSGAGRDRRAAHGRTAEALRRPGSRALQEPLRRLSPGGRARARRSSARISSSRRS